MSASRCGTHPATLRCGLGVSAVLMTVDLWLNGECHCGGGNVCRIAWVCVVGAAVPWWLAHNRSVRAIVPYSQRSLGPDTGSAEALDDGGADPIVAAVRIAEADDHDWLVHVKLLRGR
jgi:hypothetical protein